MSGELTAAIDPVFSNIEHLDEPFERRSIVSKGDLEKVRHWTAARRVPAMQIPGTCTRQIYCRKWPGGATGDVIDAICEEAVYNDDVDSEDESFWADVECYNVFDHGV